MAAGMRCNRSGLTSPVDSPRSRWAVQSACIVQKARSPALKRASASGPHWGIWLQLPRCAHPSAAGPFKPHACPRPRRTQQITVFPASRPHTRLVFIGFYHVFSSFRIPETSKWVAAQGFQSACSLEVPRAAWKCRVQLGSAGKCRVQLGSGWV